MKIYTGIGSRETPNNILNLMENIGYKFAELGWILRSGGAKGADRFFEIGADRYYIERNIKNIVYKEIFTVDNFIKTDENYQFCLKYLLPVIDKNRNFSTFKPYTKHLLLRNVHQIVGINQIPLSFTKFVICWIPIEDYWRNAGGTRYALRIAHNLNIPIFNLLLEKDRKRLEEFILK